jgi:hypothetical protein
MQNRSIEVRRHAIFKHHYRRAVAATNDFHDMTPVARWALLRAQLVAEAATGVSQLVDVLDSREPRRDEVLAKLEEGRRRDAATVARRRR